MEKSDLTRSYLETLASASLIDLADEYGIDIPENFTRQFIIAEILDVLTEYARKKKPEIKEAKTELEVLSLPISYNENRITAVLRNPVWCYVHWDFKDEDFEKIIKSPSFVSFVISILYYDKIEATNATETFDIQINKTDREQFILLSPKMNAFRVELNAQFNSTEAQLLASSLLILLPKGCPEISLSSLQQGFSSIQDLSGLPELLKMHYTNHRQSFLRDQ